MAAGTGPFRNELKFLVDHRYYTGLRERWAQHLIKDPHLKGRAQSPVLSLYYDTPDLRFYRERRDGEWFRNKLRLRTYSTRFRVGATVAFEIKQRLGQRIRKIRQLSRLPVGFENPEAWSFQEPETSSAFQALLHSSSLTPSIQIFYLREAYDGLLDRSVRVTFDSCLAGLLPREKVTDRLLWSASRRLVPETCWIMEFKCDDDPPTWFLDTVRELGLEQRSISKYALGVEKLETYLLERGCRLS